MGIKQVNELKIHLYLFRVANDEKSRQFVLCSHRQRRDSHIFLITLDYDSEFSPAPGLQYPECNMVHTNTAERAAAF